MTANDPKHALLPSPLPDMLVDKLYTTRSADYLSLTKAIANDFQLTKVAMVDIETLTKLIPQFLIPHKEILELDRAMKEHVSSIKFIETNQIQELVRNWDLVTIPRDLKELIEANKIQMADFARTIGTINVTWPDVKALERHLEGFGKLQSIGQGLHTLKPFEDSLNDMLRTVLGDWREPMSLETAAFTDPVERSNFYRARGLDVSLTDFPPEAFEANTDIAGLRSPPASVVEAYIGPSEEFFWEDDEASFARTSAAHLRLLGFETQVRRFIEGRMRKEYGDQWVLHQVPEDIRIRWEEKRVAARQARDREWPPIAYADFTDYVKIILRKDNWARVFKPVFLREALVNESFQRLYPIRLGTMHARPITQDDEIYLFAETMRLLKAMRSSWH
jgi:hypothetical protein